MPSPRKILLKTLELLLIFYVLICTALYFFQEKLIFFPDKLEKSYTFSFNEPFRELNIDGRDGKLLHGLLFTCQNARGLIFYLHGNAGALDSWGSVAKTYTDLNYDVFILDYPGYGKSDGLINSQTQLFEDIQRAYEEMKRSYREADIIVMGYSIGQDQQRKLLR
jgi:uncharacterized protein